MRRLVIILAAAASVTACAQWKGDGSDEVLPDVVGIASDHAVRPSFGVLSQTLADHADEDILHNQKSGEEAEAAGEAKPEPPHAGAQQKPGHE